MTPQQQLLLTLAQYAIKFGLDAAIQLAKAIKAGADIDTAIACLEAAEKKTAQEYFAEGEARKALEAAGGAPVVLNPPI